MIDEENLFMMEMYLENLLMYKIAYDAGFDISSFDNVQLATDYSYGFSEPFEHFMNLSSDIFEIVEVYDLYNSDEIEDIDYWLNLCDPELSPGSDFVVTVILDSRLNQPITGFTGMSFSHENDAVIYKIDDGVVVVYDEAYGTINFSDLFATLIMSLQRSVEKEVMINEVAI